MSIYAHTLLASHAMLIDRLADTHTVEWQMHPHSTHKLIHTHSHTNTETRTLAALVEGLNIGGDRSTSRG